MRGSIDTLNPVNRESPLNEGLALWCLTVPWLAGGPSWFDLAGGHAGTLTGFTNPATAGWRPPTRPGGFGELLLDGSSTTQIVSFPSTALSLPSVGLSVGAWFNPSAFTSFNTIVSKAATAAPWSSPYADFLIRLDGSSRIEYGFGATGSYAPSNASVTLTAGVWHRADLTWNGTTLTGYLDGVPVTSVALSGTASYSAQPVLIGSDYGSSPAGDYFSGRIDDVDVHGRARSAAEVFTRYQEGLSGYPTTLARVGPTIVLMGSGSGGGPDGGSGAATLGGVTASGSGGLSDAGSGADTLGQATASGTGSAGGSGSGADTLGAVAANGSGAISDAGSGADTLGALAASGTGAAGGSGSGADTLGQVAASGSGAVADPGSGSDTLGDVTASGSGTVADAGSGATTLGHATASGSGGVVDPGSGAATLGAVTASGTDSLRGGVSPFAWGPLAGQLGPLGGSRPRRRRQSTWTPLSLPGLLLWLDAADATSIVTDSGTVSQWSDRSGLGNHAVQATVEYQPSYMVAGGGGINGLGSVYSGPAGCLTLPATLLADTTALTLCVIAANDSEAGTQGAPIETLGTAGLDDHWPYSGSIYCGWGTSTYAPIPYTAGSLITPQLYTCQASSTWSLTQGSSVLSSSGTNTYGYVDPAGAVPSLFNRNAGGTFQWIGRTGEIVLCGAELGSGDLANLQGYLRSKWAVAW